MLRTFDRAGFDFNRDDDCNRLERRLRKMDEDDLRQEARSRRTGRFGWIVAATVAGGIGTNLTGLGRWLVHLLPSGIWPSTPPSP